jgi:hypothetical protein
MILVAIVVAAVGAVILAQFIDARLALALGFVGFVAWQRWSNRRAIDYNAREFGLTADQTKAVSDASHLGRDAAIAKMAEVQAQQKMQLKAAGVEVDAIVPEIGVHMRWDQIVGLVFRVREFDRAGSVITPEGKVVAASPTRPYGYLLVESPVFNQPTRLPIVHSDDFALAASVYDEDQFANAIAGRSELLVTYVPRDKLPGAAVGITHGLHYLIAPRGTLERYYEGAEGDRRMRSPNPERLFGGFIYAGNIGVKVNQDPQF